jgi:GTPase SAR1 family protein
MSMQDGCEYLFKILIIGNAYVGKSALLHQFVHAGSGRIWPADYRSTVGVDFVSLPAYSLRGFQSAK